MPECRPKVYITNVQLINSKGNNGKVVLMEFGFNNMNFSSLYQKKKGRPKHMQLGLRIASSHKFVR